MVDRDIGLPGAQLDDAVYDALGGGGVGTQGGEIGKLLQGQGIKAGEQMQEREEGAHPPAAEHNGGLQQLPEVETAVLWDPQEIVRLKILGAADLQKRRPSGGEAVFPVDEADIRQP